MKKNIKIYTAIILLIILSSDLSWCVQGRTLSDAELDGVSAGGFDFNMDAVAAYRSVVANQFNAAVISALSTTGSSIINHNIASGTSITDAVTIRQSNMGTIMASQGDINGASIDDMNDAFVNTPNPLIDISQSNLAVLAAPSGVIRDSQVSTINHVTLGDQVTGASITQSNLIVLVAQDIINTPLVYSNIVDGNVSNAVINQSTIVAHSFELDGTSVMVNINTAAQ